MNLTTNQRTWTVMIALVLSVAGSPVLAVVAFNDGQIHDIDYEIDDCVQVDYQAPAMRTTLNLLGGGNIQDYIRGCEDSQINILGGLIDGYVQAYDRSQLRISGGSIKAMSIRDSTQVNILGGSVERDVAARDSSQVRMSGGFIGWSIWFYGSSQADISGGSIGNGMWVAGSSQVHISGGSIGQQLPGYAGQREVRILTVVYGLEAYDSSEVEISGGSINGKLALDDSAVVTIHGADFAVDGEAVGYGELTSVYGGYWRSEPRRHLTGRLANGQPVHNDFYIGQEARIVLVYHTIRPPILLYVDDNAPNDPAPGDPAISDPCENGSMEHPYDAIQEAIDMAGYKGTIIVADGTYTGDGNRDIDFLGKAITVRSENGPETCIIDCQGAWEDNHRGFYFHTGENVNSVVEGFTITNGYFRYSGGSCGGGIYCRRASPTIANNIITGNCAGYAGAGICCDSSSATITNNFIAGNRNGWGAGIACLNQSSVIIENNIIADNDAGEVGGIYCEGSSMIVIGNTIRNNYGDCGVGGIGCYGSSAKILNNLIVGNFPGDDSGGGIRCWDSDAIIANNTILYNDCGGIGASGSVTVTNCIVRGHYCYEIGGALVRYSNVEGGYEGVGNIDADPCFADGDYHLKSEGWRWDGSRQRWDYDETTSRCIDAGNPSSPLSEEPISLPEDPNNIWAENIRINMGAYGGTPQASMPPYHWALLADMTNDGLVDFRDYAAQADDWLNPGDSLPGDLNRDSVIDIPDLALIAEDWLKATSWHE